LYDLAAENGYSIAYGIDEYAAAKEGAEKMILFQKMEKRNNDLPYVTERQEGDLELPQVVEKAIDFLDNSKGFFLMVEGGKIDWAAHSNDLAGTIFEMLDFDQAIAVAYEFYKKHPQETLIVVTADHETGGLALGAGEYKMNPELLACQKMSENELTSKFRQAFMPPPPPQRRGPRNGQGMAPQQPQWTPPTWEEVKEFLKVNLGLWDTVPVDKRTEERFFETYQTTFGAKEGESEVRSLYAVNTRLVSDAVMYLDRAAGYQWAHGAHTGSPVGLYVSGVRAAEFNSCSENTDIPLVIARIAGYDIQH
jgi:alkaline phosphatase